MPRRAKRERDPERSHGRKDPDTALLRPLAHSVRVQSGCGWRSERLCASSLEPLLHKLEAMPLSGARYREHSAPGEQGADAPMMQRYLKGSPEWSQWRTVVENSVSTMSTLLCPACGESAAAHTIVAADLNVMVPGAALWPHTDVSPVCVHYPTCIVLLRVAQSGGLLRAAREAGGDGVLWREVGDRAQALARRARDSVCIPLLQCGDVCMLDGANVVHEVTKVTGPTTRVTLVMTMGCVRRGRGGTT